MEGEGNSKPPPLQTEELLMVDSCSSNEGSEHWNGLYVPVDGIIPMCIWEVLIGPSGLRTNNKIKTKQGY